MEHYNFHDTESLIIYLFFITGSNDSSLCNHDKATNNMWSSDIPNHNLFMSEESLTVVGHNV